MSFAVVIPSKTPNNILPCVSCIRAAHETCDIVIVDDFSPEDSARLRTSGPEHIRKAQWVPGQKPFVFSRNVNLGIAACGDLDLVISNDDTCLRTPYGFSLLAAVARDNPEYGIISAGITAAVGNEEQIAQPGSRLRETTHHTLVFVCVYIRREVLNKLQHVDLLEHVRLGHATPLRWMDERFVNYGFCDDNTCEEVRQLGLKLGVFDGCVVEHGVLESSYRGKGSASSTDLAPNRQRFIDKWGFAPGQGPSMKKAAPATDPVKW